MENKSIGMILIGIGVAMWPVGLFVLRWKPFPGVLALHLFFIFSGIYYRRIKK